ncbi:MAG: glycosyltransferase family 2 protein [Selenomonas ruminantium]|nr:glycosyltransferase family 2 protein [Selenomonas ruminantium]
MKKLQISACAIMKDEERHIGRWLACVRQFADEIIVVDTGSVDRTAELAVAGGAQVYKFPWQDDFSAAKNFALDKARGHWVAFLDADEYFPPESLDKVRPLLERLEPDFKVAGVLCRWVNFDEDEGMELQGADVQLRLFRNLRSLRYRGRIHEALAVPPRYRVVATEEVEIHHTGYSKSLIRGKLERNRRLILQQLAAEGREPTIAEQSNLLDCAYGLGEMEEVCRLAQALIAAPGRRDSLQSSALAGAYREYFSALVELGASRAEIEAVIARAEHEFPQLPDFPLMLGTYYTEQGEKEAALRKLQQGLKLYESASRAADAADLNSLSANAEAMVQRARECMALLEKSDVFISACAIMKDEEENLPSWLESVRSFADEIIVVDTGSSDRTKKLAAAGGARVLDFAWQDDFGAAKNFAIDKAGGRWIAFLDADETFSVSSRHEVRPLLERLDSKSGIRGVACRMVNIDRDDHNRYMTEKLKVRIFRKLPSIRYVGRIHETLEGLPDSCLYQAEGLLLYHTGYSSSLVRQKLERNLALLQRQAAREGSVAPEDYHYYMDCYYGLYDYPQAMAWARKVIEDSRQSRLLQEEAWETYLSSLVRGAYPLDRTLAAFEEARRACPDMPRFTLMQGLYLFSQKDYLQAEALLRQGLAAPAQGEGRDIRRLQPHALSKLAELALWQGRSSEAAEGCIEALQINPYLAGTVRLLAEAMQQSGLGDADIIEILSKLYEKEDEPFLAETLRPLGGKLAIFYARRTGEPQDSETSYSLAGQWGAATEKLTRRLSLLTLLAAWQAKAVDDSTLQEKLGQLMAPAWQEAWQSYRATPGQIAADWRIRVWQRLDKQARSINREKGRGSYGGDSAFFSGS